MSSTDDIKRTSRDPAAACAGKVAFASFTLADLVGKRRTAQARGRKPYRCGNCGMWHVGSDVSKAELQRHRQLKERQQNGK